MRLVQQTPLGVYFNSLAREANSYIFGSSDTFPNSASTSLWTKLVDLTTFMKYLRIGEFIGSVILFGIGIVMTDWRNEGYAWYIHNSIMGVTVLAIVRSAAEQLTPYCDYHYPGSRHLLLHLCPCSPCNLLGNPLCLLPIWTGRARLRIRDALLESRLHDRCGSPWDGPVDPRLAAQLHRIHSQLLHLRTSCSLGRALRCTGLPACTLLLWLFRK